MAMQDRTLIIIVAMVCITILQSINLMTVNIDTAVMNTVLMLLSGLGGYFIHRKRRR